MLDCQLFALNAGPPHVANAILHTLNALVLFGFLLYISGSVWRSGFVAAIFALHPLRVESVAWITERRDLLCGLFSLLTLWAYVRWVEQPRKKRFVLVLAAYCLALMSKPMAVTLP